MSDAISALNDRTGSSEQVQPSWCASTPTGQASLMLNDFALNYLNGTIPKAWTSMDLSSISLLVNRVPGEIPKELGKMASLTYLSLESNQFSGLVPPELGNLINLQTLGYMAPEYALRGYLTYKADVYSFGAVVLEIISGKSNNDYMPSDSCVCLLDWACHLYKTENVIQLVDESLGSELEPKEVAAMVKVALLCTNAPPSLRPIMSEVVNMLEGRMSIPEVNLEQSAGEDLRFRALRDIQKHRESHSMSTNQPEYSTDTILNGSSLTSDHDL